MKELRSNLLKSFLLTMIMVGLSIGYAEAASTRRFDGSWDIVFNTRAGACDPAYNFTVNISRGIITHPNLVRFKRSVNESGFTRASVAVGDKFASGSGKLTSGSGSGAWSGSQEARSALNDGLRAAIRRAFPPSERPIRLDVEPRPQDGSERGQDGATPLLRPFR